MIQEQLDNINMYLTACTWRMTSLEPESCSSRVHVLDLCFPAYGGVRLPVQAWAPPFLPVCVWKIHKKLGTFFQSVIRNYYQELTDKSFLSPEILEILLWYAMGRPGHMWKPGCRLPRTSVLREDCPRRSGLGSWLSSAPGSGSRSWRGCPRRPILGLDSNIFGPGQWLPLVERLPPPASLGSWFHIFGPRRPWGLDSVFSAPARDYDPYDPCIRLSLAPLGSFSTFKKLLRHLTTFSATLFWHTFNWRVFLAQLFLDFLTGCHLTKFFPKLLTKFPVQIWLAGISRDFL